MKSGVCIPTSAVHSESQANRRGGDTACVRWSVFRVVIQGSIVSVPLRTSPSQSQSHFVIDDSKLLLKIYELSPTAPIFKRIL